MSIAAALQHAQQSGIDPLDAQWLMLHLLGRDLNQRAWLRAHDSDVLSAAVCVQWTQLCQRRLDRVPLAYLIGQRGFYGLELCVDGRVLDPRPDTETLVDWALHLLTAQIDANTPPNLKRVLDLGTGSGAIALALKHVCPAAEVWAVDASTEALAVAEHNAQRLKLDVRLCLSDWFDGLTASGPWSLIVSNPPYIAEDDPHLSLLRHEPRSALSSGADGLNDLRRIIAQTPDHLRFGGWLLLEHGHDQAPAVAELLTQRGFVTIETRHDLAGMPRCTGGRWMTTTSWGVVCAPDN